MDDVCSGCLFTAACTCSTHALFFFPSCVTGLRPLWVVRGSERSPRELWLRPLADAPAAQDRHRRAGACHDRHGATRRPRDGRLVQCRSAPPPPRGGAPWSRTWWAPRSWGAPRPRPRPVGWLPLAQRPAPGLARRLQPGPVCRCCQRCRAEPRLPRALQPGVACLVGLRCVVGPCSCRWRRRLCLCLCLCCRTPALTLGPLPLRRVVL